MTFEVGTRFEKSFFIRDGNDIFSFAQNSGISIYWAFTFYNKEVQKIQGTIDTAKNTVKFTIPDGFFAEERVGPLSHRLVIQDTDDVPTILSEIINDKLIIASPSLAELNI